MELSKEFKDYMLARNVIEDVEIGRAHNIGGGGKYIVGRLNATSIMKALTKAGFTVSYRPTVDRTPASTTAVDA